MIELIKRAKGLGMSEEEICACIEWEMGKRRKEGSLREIKRCGEVVNQYWDKEKGIWRDL